eukprot:scaffold171949_cov27-Tisochrysis_lutea.AAC.1
MGSRRNDSSASSSSGRSTYTCNSSAVDGGARAVRIAATSKRVRSNSEPLMIDHNVMAIPTAAVVTRPSTVRTALRTSSRNRAICLPVEKVPIEKNNRWARWTRRWLLEGCPRRAKGPNPLARRAAHGHTFKRRRK